MFNKDLLLDDLLQEMGFTDAARGLTERTVKKNTVALKMFFQFIDSCHGVQYLHEVTPKHIREFMLYKYQSGCKESYVNGFLKSLRAFFVFCEEEEYITPLTNPCLRVKWMKEEKPMIDSFNNEELLKLLNYSKSQTRKYYSKGRGSASWFFAERDLLMLLLFADTGMRLFELCNLKDSDFRDNGIRIYGKGKKVRYVYCSAPVMKQKIKYERAKSRYFEKTGVRCEDYIFLSKIGKKWTSDIVQRNIRTLAKEAGCDMSIRWSPHTFRHYFTQQQVQNGADLFTLQRLLGHSSVKVTEEYLRSLKSEIILQRGLETSPLNMLDFS